ncbi:dynein axonemal assembly factor 8 isoform X1 [Astyanax mexicanus]|uniref:dynein axonemal assembly factor 8 isoform X1 n=1 Tax=Astyanax mexicanus TaxID=7994 RepID=UPI0020CAE208|nr:dynein axonemal assembly factor 8 isoform X1 [Astyanax mexicanus]
MQDNSVYNSVTAQIPSLDSDLSSSSDNEEEIRVYRRPSIFKLSLEEEEELSLEEPETEDLLKSITEPFSYETEEDPTPIHSEKPSDQKCQTFTELEDLEKPVISSNESGRLSTEATDVQNSPEHDQKKADIEMISDEELTHPEPEAGDACGTQSLENEGRLALSLKPLENLDLDQILHSLKQEHNDHHECTNEQVEPLTVQLVKCPDYSNGRADSNTMNQLETFCKQESMKTETKMISSSETSSTQRQHINSPSVKRTPEELTNTFHHTKEQLCQKNSDSPTIFIDLRITDHQTEPPAAVCNKSSCTDQLMQDPDRGEVGNALPEVPERNRMLSGKCLLLQKLRESNQAKAETSMKRTTTPEDCPQEEKMSGISRREDLHSCLTPHPVKHLDKTSLPTATSDEASVRMNNPPS